ncbi:MAG: peroxiredoxin [Deltaproteobacteria bacterium]|nr:MAG: peroxiredoxin [Deltaproteobacteria bacterium]
MLTIGDQFPEFELVANTSTDINSGFTTLTNKSFEGKWKCYFFWPKDFTFVCPTEIVGFGELEEDFADRDCQLIGGSTDSDFVHLSWRKHHADLTDSPFPWLSDIKGDLCTALGILGDDGVAQRATFLVDPNNEIQFVMVTAGSVGRNPKEVLRVLDALQSDELCPCNWSKGEETLSVA